MTDRRHGSGSVQTCRSWGSPASQLALGLHPQDLPESVGTESMGMTRRERGQGKSVEVCSKAAPASEQPHSLENPSLASSRISVDNVAPGIWLGYLRSAESNLWKGGRGKASTRPCQAMHCHSLFLKPQKSPHPFYSSLFPHQPCVRCSWAMDLGKPCHLHLMGKQQQSPWQWGSPSPAPPSR